MSKEFSREDCLAVNILNWPEVACPGPEFKASQMFGKAACEMCISRCFDKVYQEKEVARIEKMQANIDSVTGLPNRQVFDNDFIKLRRRNRPFGLLMLDVDGLHRANEALGHSQGDEVLLLLAMTVAEQLRPSDKLYRIGGDEFAALLFDMPDDKDTTPTTEESEQFCKRFEDAFERSLDAAGFDPSLYLGLSAGYGVLVQGGEEVKSNADTLYDEVDAMMFARKRARRAGREKDGIIFLDDRELPPAQYPE